MLGTAVPTSERAGGAEQLAGMDERILAEGIGQPDSAIAELLAVPGKVLRLADGQMVEAIAEPDAGRDRVGSVVSDRLNIPSVR